MNVEPFQTLVASLSREFGEVGTIELLLPEHLFYRIYLSLAEKPTEVRYQNYIELNGVTIRPKTEETVLATRSYNFPPSLNPVVTEKAADGVFYANEHTANFIKDMILRGLEVDEHTARR